MKKILLVYVFVLIMFNLFSSCKSSPSNSILDRNTDKNISSLSKLSTYNWSLFDIPSGAHTTINGSTIQIVLPSPYMGIGVDSMGNYVYSKIGGTVSITCECKSGNGGCSPGQVGGTYACVMKECKNCSKLNSIEDANLNTILKEMIIVDTSEFSFIQSMEELEGKLILPQDFYNLPIVTSKLKELESHLLPSSNITLRKLVPISLLGYIVFIDIPADIDNTSPFLHVFGDRNSNTTCNCDIGTDCPYKSKLVAKWCDATNCKKCTMSGSVYSFDSKVVQSLSIINGRIHLSN